MLYGHLLAHGFFEGNVRRINTLHTGKASLHELLTITNPACYQTDRHPTRLLEDAHRQLTHQCLTVSRTLTSNHEVGIFDDFAEVDGV